MLVLVCFWFVGYWYVVGSCVLGDCIFCWVGFVVGFC